MESWVFFNKSYHRNEHICNVRGYTTSKIIIFEFIIPANTHLFKVNNRNNRKRCEIDSKLTVKTSERRHLHHSGVFLVNLEHMSHLFLVFLLLTLHKKMLPGMVYKSVLEINYSYTYIKRKKRNIENVLSRFPKTEKRS